jgi:ParB/RepB/Spo0J family partition protein
MAKEKKGLETLSKGQSSIYNVDPRVLKVRDGWNCRDFSNPENAAYIEELAASIMEGGVREPLTVSYEKGIAYIDDGECRYRAACLVIERTGQEIRIPVKSEDRYASPQDRLINQRIRNSGKQFTVFEDAAFFNRLLTVYKMTQEEIARKCNISQGRVSQILEYNKVGKVGRELVANGQASPSLVMEVTKSEGSDAEKALLKGIQTAKANGHTKIKPEDVAGTRINVAKAVRDAFEYADVDDTDDKMVVVKFPVDKFEALKKAAKL